MHIDIRSFRHGLIITAILSIKLVEAGTTLAMRSLTTRQETINR